MSTYRKVASIEELLTGPGVPVTSAAPLEVINAPATTLDTSDSVAQATLAVIVTQGGHPGVNAQLSNTGIYVDSEPKSGWLTFDASNGETALVSGMDDGVTPVAKFLSFDNSRTGVQLGIRSTAVTDSYSLATGAFLVRVQGVDSNGDSKGVWVRMDGTTEVIVTENEDGTGGAVLWWAVNTLIVLPSAPVGFGPQPLLNTGTIHIGIAEADTGSWTSNLADNGTLWNCIEQGSGISGGLFIMASNDGDIYVHNGSFVGDNAAGELTTLRVYRNNNFGRINLKALQVQIDGQIEIDVSSIPFLSAGDVLFLTVQTSGNQDHFASGNMNCWAVTP